MSAISVQTKKFGDLDSILEASDSGLLLVHDGNNVKTITVGNFKQDLRDLISDLSGNIAANNAGAHNAIYRGKCLGTEVTAEQYASIVAGTFEDMYIGDYWTISTSVTVGGTTTVRDINYRIAAFDYFLHCGDTETTAHHVVIVPDTSLYNAQMNTSNVTTGGYMGSAMYTANLTPAKNAIKTAFGASHILSHRVYLTNAVTNGYASGGAWADSDIELMCEHMVYGNGIFSPVSTGSVIPANYRVEKSQLPLFTLEPSRITNRETWWLRDVISAAYFALVGSNGLAIYDTASGSLGVRPAFSIS